MSGLKPCPNPFCERSAPYVVYDDTGSPYAFVECDECGLIGPMASERPVGEPQYGESELKRNAATCWNYRTPDPRIAELIATPGDELRREFIEDGQDPDEVIARGRIVLRNAMRAAQRAPDPRVTELIEAARAMRFLVRRCCDEIADALLVYADHDIDENAVSMGVSASELRHGHDRLAAALAALKEEAS